jgi:hypothetical protein
VTAYLSVRNGRVSSPYILGAWPSDYRAPWLVLAKFICEFSKSPADALPQSGSAPAEQRKERARSTRRGCLVALGVFGALVAIGSIVSENRRPAREFSKNVAAACDVYVGTAARDSGLFSYSQSKRLCVLVRHIAYKRFGKIPTDQVAEQATFDSCLLLATDASKSGDDEDNLPRVPRYYAVPAHFAREHVALCGGAARLIAEEVRHFGGRVGM